MPVMIIIRSFDVNRPTDIESRSLRMKKVLVSRLLVHKEGSAVCLHHSTVADCIWKQPDIVTSAQGPGSRAWMPETPVHRPGEEVANLKGGVAGGSILKGASRSRFALKKLYAPFTITLRGMQTWSHLRS